MRDDVAIGGRQRLWAGLALGAVLWLGAALRLWRLDENGFGREYFAAGVRSMLASWHNLFYASFDPAGFVSLDKPPVAFWLQALSAKLLGFSEFALLLPQVIEGVACILLVHHLVRPRFGRLAALLAALFLALTPISVAIDRSNNTDSCLVLALLLAAWAAIRAAETANLPRLLLAMVILGVAFNVKMLAGLIVAPAILLAYLVGTTKTPPRRQLAHMAAAGVVLVGVSLSWSVAYDLTPAQHRPYVSGSKDNSMLELALLYNGLKRFETVERAVVAPTTVMAKVLYDDTPVGPLRLATPRLAAQVGWLLPLAFAGILCGAWRSQRVSLTLWTAWAAVYAVVYSAAGGLFHAYYLATMAPALAVLSGIGVAGMASQHHRGGWRGLALPVSLLLTAGWQAYIQFDYVDWSAVDWRAWIYVGVPMLIGASALGLLGPRRVGALALPPALVALLITPTAWALSTVLVPTNVTSPRANVSALVNPAPLWAAADWTRLLGLLRANRGDERFALAMPNALQAAPLVVRFGLPIMAMGGYLGSDPILKPEDLASLVERRQLRFVMLGGFSLAPINQPHQRAVADWVRRHGQPVDLMLWYPKVSGTALPPGHYTRPGLYDLRPSDGLVALRTE